MTTVYDYLVREFQEMVEARREAVIKGNIESMEQYKYLVGVINGLELAKEFTERARKQHEEYDSED